MSNLSRYLFSLSILASKDVGKKMLRRFLPNTSQRRTAHTIGVEFFIKDIEIAGKSIRLTIHLYFYEEEDLPDIKHSLIRSAANNQGVLLLYDITNLKSLTILSEWYKLLKKNVERDIPFFLVGNKKDLEEHREVSKEHIEKFKEKCDITTSMEISLKTGENVEEMFVGITRLIITILHPDLIQELNE
ncbi:MAG: Rab family GTPase [Promethearchaeota archaeon]